MIDILNDVDAAVVRRTLLFCFSSPFARRDSFSEDGSQYAPRRMASRSKGWPEMAKLGEGNCNVDATTYNVNNSTT